MNTTLKAAFVSGVLVLAALGAAGAAQADAPLDPAPPAADNGAANGIGLPSVGTLPATGLPANGLADPGGATNGVAQPPNGLPLAHTAPLTDLLPKTPPTNAQLPVGGLPTQP
ncbi:hypothetical protein DMA15_19575 [Streptomyces sp. WAC 01529]|uniref:hypothetical protein n=1 Tax=Streptomyces sp. WAC 01529 TaxID=2203205 RepID=UPI000F6F0630|nr:hypothetical protein [Streptomyces sp. WAC 01529]AZM54491.1 hypothetical protein DMA15_19575 [Streptomyces sp. WAC 01529]